MPTAVQSQHPQAGQADNMLVEASTTAATSTHPLPQSSAHSVAQPSAQPSGSVFSRSIPAPTIDEPLQATAGNSLPHPDSLVQGIHTAAVPLQVPTASQVLPSHGDDAILITQHTPTTNRPSQPPAAADTSATPISLTGNQPSACLPSNRTATTLPTVQDQSPPRARTSLVAAAKGALSSTLTIVNNGERHVDGYRLASCHPAIKVTYVCKY